MHHERGDQFAEAGTRRGAPQSVLEVEPEDVHRIHGGFLRTDRAQRLEVRLVGERGQQDEVAHASTRLPRVDKFVHDPVERLSAKGDATLRGARGGMYAVLERGCPHDAPSRRDVIGEMLHDDRVRAEGQARALQRRAADGNQQEWTLREALHRFGGEKGLQTPGLTVIAHRIRGWVPLLILTLVLAAEWLRAAEDVWAWSAAAAALATAALLPHDGRSSRQALAGLLALTALILLVAQHRLDRIERHWDAEREAIVEAAGGRLGAELHGAFDLTEALATDAVPLASLDRAEAFRGLERALRRTGLDAGVAILEHDGTPWAWAGRHRLTPQPEGDSIAAAWSQYYVTLESRRHSARGRTVVASVLVWAHPSVPAREGSLAERFRAGTQVALEVLRPSAAPDSPDVFDYCEPTTAGPRCLFSAVPIPPGQADARGLVLSRGGPAIAVLLLLVLLAGIVAADRVLARWLLAPLFLWLPLRAPVGSLVGASSLFSPATYFYNDAAPLTGSAGVLALSATLVLLAAIWLWQRRLPRRWWRVALGALVVVATPYLIGDLSRGVAPPSGGTPMGLWVSWQVALFFVGAALVLLASALMHGRGAPRRGVGWTWLGVGLGVGAAVVGMAVWDPSSGWPAWFPLLWLPALMVAAFPVPPLQAVVSVALAAGSLASLLTWSAELRGRTQLAQREVARLGEAEDPVARGLLGLFADDIASAPVPTGAAELFALWRRSLLATQGYPVQLALWEPGRGWYADLALDSLEVRRSLLDSLVARAPRRDLVVPVQAVPGLHYVLLAPVADSATLVAVVGPGTRLVAPSRLGRLLEPHEDELHSYQLALAPARAGSEPPAAMRWRRDGWVVQTSRPLVVADSTRAVTVQLALGAPGSLLLRGAALLLLDAALLGLLWIAAGHLAGSTLPELRLRTVRESFRGNIALTLALFFIVPAGTLALWGFGQLASESRRAADALVSHRLADVMHASGGLLEAEQDSIAPALRALSDRVDAHFGYYRGGRLAGTSATVLSDLGVLPPLMDQQAFRGLALNGRLDVIRDGPARELAERVGYRLIRPGPPSQLGVLALPQQHAALPSGPREDLAFALLLALVTGLAAAIVAAQRTARTLARPVGSLRRAALALGAGEPSSRVEEDALHPTEFAPVFGAFRRVEADLRAGREALEAARRRTERVLATVSTGVVALDGDGHVLLANGQAAAMLQMPLTEGLSLEAHLPADWRPLAEVVGEARRARAAGELSLEVARGERRIAAQLASFGGDHGGVVIALTDVTELSRAERVLAWGEMARQVAHEIKNPLTPMRLGVQHLQRTWRDRRGDFAGTLEQTTARILGEIDRLDTVARAFSRFGAPSDADSPLEPVDLAMLAREVGQLYALAGEGATVHIAGPAPVLVRARRDEVKEVLVNLLENARNAGARTIDVETCTDGFVVRDDGAGIPAESLPRVFEPQFSTTTSGSGLGLSIVRRLVESWGARIAITSEPGQGTTASVRGVPPG
jgi:two-component system nitrogen regulation sensor histidine kinase NtrY